MSPTFIQLELQPADEDRSINSPILSVGTDDSHIPVVDQSVSNDSVDICGNNDISNSSLMSSKGWEMSRFGCLSWTDPKRLQGLIYWIQRNN